MKRNILKDNKGQTLLVIVILSLFLIIGLMTSVLLYMFNHHRQKLKEFEALKLFYYADSGAELAMLNIKDDPNYYSSNPLQEVNLPGINYPVTIKVFSLGYDNRYQISSYASKTRAGGEVIIARRIDVLAEGKDEDEDGQFEEVEVVKWREILPPANPAED